MTFILSIILTSCVYCYYPPPKTRLINFEYSDNEISQTFRTDKSNFLRLCSRLSERFILIKDSIYSTSFQVSDERIFATAKVILINKDSLVKIRLSLIDTLKLYVSKDGEDTTALYKVDKIKCLTAFQKNYIPNLLSTINNCIKVDSLYKRGLYHVQKNQYDESYSAFQAVTTTNLSDNDVFNFEKYSALNRMAYIKIQQKQYDTSIELLNKALMIEPWWLNLNNRTQFRTKGKLPDWVKDKYIDELKSEYKYNSESIEQLLLHANLALAYLKTGKLNESKLAIDKAEKLYPSDPYLTSIKNLYKDTAK